MAVGFHSSDGDEGAAGGSPAANEGDGSATQLAEAVAEVVLANARADDEADVERTQRFTESALEACRRYTRETSRLARRHDNFQREFGSHMISSWTREQLGASASHEDVPAGEPNGGQPH